jgi:hypothetical protein
LKWGWLPQLRDNAGWWVWKLSFDGFLGSMEKAEGISCGFLVGF